MIAHHNRVKPLDFGADGVNGSLDADGRMIALNSFHPEQGYVTLTSAAPFPEMHRYQPAAVRAYRAELARQEGFGLHFQHRIVSREAKLVDDVIPHIRLVLDEGSSATVITFGCAGGVLQQWEILGSPLMRWGGRLSLGRCAYTQLTEGGPIPPPPIETRLRFDKGLLTIENPALRWAVGIAGFPAGETREYHLSSHIDYYMDLSFPSPYLTLAYGFGPTAQAAGEHARAVLQHDVTIELMREHQRWNKRWERILPDPLTRRGLAYSHMMAVPVDEGVCLLTDHMLLPLAWNRDAYYMARALLSWTPEMADLVGRHLIWMFEQAERPDGLWGRCYLANGRLKDAAFQLDQQLYPLLELAEYTLHTEDRELFRRLRPHIRPLLDRLLARRAAKGMIFPTDETPADDPIALPYHLSSHIVFWRALTLLERLQRGYADMAANIRAAIDKFFIASQNRRRLYAYATDGAKGFHFYHDANDFPLVLAPLWGLCSADDRVWRATIDFAFSEANLKGIYQGRLGSVHTPAPWPLGDVQELMVARLLRESTREATALKHLRAAAQPDGALPEAYDALTGGVVSRDWFAWPNAAYACTQLNAFAEFG